MRRSFLSDFRDSALSVSADPVKPASLAAITALGRDQAEWPVQQFMQATGRHA